MGLSTGPGKNSRALPRLRPTEFRHSTGGGGGGLWWQSAWEKNRERSRVALRPTEFRHRGGGCGGNSAMEKIRERSRVALRPTEFRHSRRGGVVVEKGWEKIRERSRVALRPTEFRHFRGRGGVVVATGPWKKIASAPAWPLGPPSLETSVVNGALEKIRERFRVALSPTEFINIRVAAVVVAKGPWQKFASSGRERLLAARVLEKIRERFRGP